MAKNDPKKKKMNPKIAKPEKEKREVLDERKADDDDHSSTTNSDVLTFADRVAQKRGNLDI